MRVLFALHYVYVWFSVSGCVMFVFRYKQEPPASLHGAILVSCCTCTHIHTHIYICILMKTHLVQISRTQSTPHTHISHTRMHVYTLMDANITPTLCAITPHEPQCLQNHTQTDIYVYIYMYIYICMYMYVYITPTSCATTPHEPQCLQNHTQTDMYVCMYVCIYVCMYIHIYICMYVYVYIHHTNVVCDNAA